MAILELHDVKKNFGDKQVLKGLTFEVPEGSIFGFVGENSAGKTTTMKMILGLETIDSGQILIDGKRVHYGNSLINRMVGYLPDVPKYYGYMTPKEYLTLCGQLTGISKNDLSDRIEKMLKIVDLPINKHRIHGFSRGMKQRLGIAQALLNHPKLLICDEPTSALDPIGRSEFLNLLTSLKGETTIVFSTHILTDVERISDYVGILHDGVLKANDSLDNLKTQYAKSQIIFEFISEDTAEKAAQILGKNSHNNQKQVILNYTGDYQIIAETVLNTLLQSHLIPISMNRQKTNLEDIFMEVTA
ncbi:ABC transporter ATP-binding protein [Companilactobacillus nantensis]|uniref:ABC transporter ATPase n=1 Tax=Companilactobacillus nantensis DSM 16982 TaxID=1423774 RepID=A0A0R1WD00_9LACO|nr:ABC transporter ATP-binding protein [Companilactobacillus nantensis]KRM15808.1 ABC transporter ATPase [Companilactobacillus nantensis DSM 16982]GEO64593.1 ABC transporter ATP-binding protein [Companilactobacillus nantensis]